MELQVKNNRIYLKPFSPKWVNYHWITAWLVVFGALILYYYLKDLVQGSANWNWLTSSLLICTGLLVYSIKFKGLRMKRIPFPEQQDEVKVAIRKLLSDWEREVEYDNFRYLQARCTRGIPVLNADVLLLKWNAGEIRWNVIYNSGYNGSGGIFTYNRQGRRIVKEIKSLVKEQTA